MTNEERRQALALARRAALDYANLANAAGQCDITELDAEALAALVGNIRLATMWSHVAQCMKVGNAIETDGADGNGDVLTRGGDEYFASHIR